MAINNAKDAAVTEGIRRKPQVLIGTGLRRMEKENVRQKFSHYERDKPFSDEIVPIFSGPAWSHGLSRARAPAPQNLPYPPQLIHWPVAKYGFAVDIALIHRAEIATVVRHRPMVA